MKAFAVELHRRPGVAEACLVLQDRAGLDVNLLLAAAWLAAGRRVVVTPADVARLAEHVRAWHGEIVMPLRAVRRRLKSGPHPAPCEATARLRADLQAVEIAAELLELDEIEAAARRLSLQPSALSAAAAAAAGMRVVIAHFAGRQPDDGETAAVATIASAAEALACAA